MRVVIDVEANKLIDPDVIWCIVAKDIDTGKKYEFLRGNFDEFEVLMRKADMVIGHNIISWDYPCICRVLGSHVLDPVKLTDTLVLSHLFNFGLEGGHSLDTWGKRLGIQKEGLGITDWTRYNPVMLARCHSDVAINACLYEFLTKRLKSEHFQEAIDCEHKIAHICMAMHRDGFAFNRDDCIKLLLATRERLASIDVQLDQAFPPKVKETQLKTKVKVETIPFNAGSPKQLVERLNECGWKPTEKTKSGKSWKVNEVNLATLPDTAPEAARKLVERILLRSRVSTMETWLGAYNNDTSCIHGTFRGLGTWTHRMGHRNPNMGNISAEKSIKYSGEYLRKLAISYGGDMRRMWTTSHPDSWLVGCDADSIQLRIFAHYIDDPKFTEALLSGSKDNGTDPHSVNGRILNCTRDTAKTFIYAFLLGAGDRKIGEILGTNTRAGKAAKERFINAYPGLKKLRQDTIPGDAARGYFRGFDGRLVVIPGEDQGEREHLALAGYLQNGEAVIMKHACILWRKELRERGIDFTQRNFVHDEWQTELKGTYALAEQVGQIQSRAITSVGGSFKLRCPMAGNYVVGKNWLETH